MRSRVILALVLFAVAPATAAAQFTTFIAPAKKVDTVKTPTVAEARAKADSTTRVALTNMKAWVDSAAGVSVPVDTAPIAPLDTTPTAQRTRRARAVTTTFRNGAPAPETASDLPLLAIVGVAALGIGAAILATRRA